MFNIYVCYRVISRGIVLELKNKELTDFASVQVVIMPRGGIPAPLEFHHSAVRFFSPQSLFPTYCLPILIPPNFTLQKKLELFLLSQDF